MPGTPGILSDESPIRLLTSMSWRRLHAVLFADGGGVHGNRLLCWWPAERWCCRPPTAGCPGRRWPAGVVATGGLAGGGQGAQNIVGLPALTAHLHKAQVGQQFFQYGHLLGQLLGHAVAGGLVAVVGLVAEGRGAFRSQAMATASGLWSASRLSRIFMEAVDGVGIAAVLGGQQLDAVKTRG